MHEIPIKQRADILLFLCHLKADTPEYNKFIKKVQKDEVYQVSESAKEDIIYNDSRGWCDTEPILLGEDLTGVKYMYFDTHRDCRVYSQATDLSDLVLETNSPEELKFLITKLTEQSIKIQEEQKNKEEKGKKRKTRQAKSKSKSDNKQPKDNSELIKGKQSMFIFRIGGFRARIC